jgi:endonuclease/exonuclease/phosphatase family metal-dependent hydrolase
MTYNVHSCIGLDGKLSPARIARVIAYTRPDIVALQELDVRRARSGRIDQAHDIARALEMEFHFHPALEVEEEQYGNAVLSRFPLRLLHAGPLPSLPLPGLEPRGALFTAIDVDGHEIHLLNTHLGLTSRERLRQVEALLGPEWLDHPRRGDSVIVCGDFNARPSSKEYHRLVERLRDAQVDCNGHRPVQTWFSRFPLARIDHVFVGKGFSVKRVHVQRNSLTSVASDHLPLVVDLTLEPAAAPVG